MRMRRSGMGCASLYRHPHVDRSFWDYQEVREPDWQPGCA